MINRESRANAKSASGFSSFCGCSNGTLKIIILRNRRTYVTSTTTLRRHLEREHEVRYLNSVDKFTANSDSER